MSVKLKAYGTNIGIPGDDDSTEYIDNTQDQRETTVDGYTFHWGVNQTRNFADDSVGIRHQQFASANATGVLNVTLDRIPFGDATS